MLKHQGMKIWIYGGAKLKLHALSISAIHESDWLASRSGRFTHYEAGWVTTSGDKDKTIHAPADSRTADFQAVAS
jgi:hypothetical protein